MMVFTVFTALLGAAVGSFLNVCIYRLPREGLSVSRPARSFCPACGSPIRWHDNIPIMSWLLLGARCRDCRAPIPARYVLVELLTALLFAAVALRYLVPGSPGSFVPLAFVAVATLVAAAIVGSFIDLELRIIPDEVTVRGMMLAPLAALAAPEVHRLTPESSVPRLLSVLAPEIAEVSGALPAALREGAGPWTAAALAAAALGTAGLWAFVLPSRTRHGATPRPLRDGLLAGVLSAFAGGMGVLCLLRPDLLATGRVQAFWASTLGMLAGSGLVFTVGFVGSKAFRKPAMGLGDVKLMGLFGAFTGWAGVLESFFIACVLGSAVGIYCLLRFRSRYIPFGPFLTAGALLTVLWPEAFEAVFRWYLGLFVGL
ncbi:MAG: prepilin peptidase [Planctomycetes bacterium]|nr:prepilin peptidase [Planctomycetota bacterium]